MIINLWTPLILNRLTLNQFVYLDFRHKGIIPPPDLIDSPNIDKALMLKGFMTDKGAITPSGIKIIDEFYGQIEPKKKVVITSQMKHPQVDDLLLDYRDYFPKGAVSGRVLRTSPTDLKKRFNDFFKKYPDYTWEEVLDATEMYANTFKSSANGHTYMKNSTYFIMKDGVSELASTIESLRDTDGQVLSSGYVHD
jgi:hypothetical protein